MIQQSKYYCKMCGRKNKKEYSSEKYFMLHVQINHPIYFKELVKN